MCMRLRSAAASPRARTPGAALRLPETDSIRKRSTAVPAPDAPACRVSASTPMSGCECKPDRAQPSINVAIAARDRVRLERLCRYAARPPLAIDRLEALPDG